MSFLRFFLVASLMTLAVKNSQASCDSTASLASLQSVCFSSDTIQLSGALPLGGYFFGSGIVDSSGAFVPSQAGVGFSLISYVYTDSVGCSDTASQNVQVKALPGVNLSAFDSVCLNTSSFQLTQGSGSTAAGFGVYTGNGVSGTNLFNPNVAGLGLSTITYTYTDSVTACSKDTSASIYVKALPNLSFPSLSDRCFGDDTLSLTSASPSGGKYYGPLVLSDSVSLLADSVGLFQVFYRYTDPSSSCTNTISRNIRIRALPTITMNPISAVCLNDSAFTLATGNPLGGKYWGTGITDSSGVFSPGIADTGTHTIFYRFTNSFSCSNTDSTLIQVQQLPNVSIFQFAICENSPPFTLNLGFSSASGTGVYSGNAVLNGIFYPAMGAVGPTQVSYTFTDTSTGCSNTATTTATILAKPNITPAVQSQYCENQDADTLNFPQPMGGRFYGPGMLSDSLRFDPDSAGVGTFTITYRYRALTFCTNTLSFVVKVNPKPTVSASAQNDRCESDTAFVLSGHSPIGGTYSGNGVVNSGSSFSAVQAGVGTHSLTYSFTNGFSCTDSAFTSVKVNANPILSLSAIPDFCEDAGRQDLGSYLSADSSGTGIFVGQGMLNDSIFSPNSIGGGNYQLNYRYTDNNNCKADTSFTIRVFDKPNLSLNPFATYCLNDNIDTLRAANPIGGSYFGSGISSDSIFSPASAGVGLHSISYTLTNSDGCSDTLSRDIEVFALPVVSFSLQASVCENESDINLSGSPVGGTFSGNGVFNSVFIPDSAGVGNTTLYYSYADSNGCISVDSNTIAVHAKPTVSLSAIPDLCLDLGTYSLSQGSPAGGTYSLTANPSALSGSNLNLNTLGAGTFQIAYSLVNVNACVDTARVNVRVHPQPNVGLSLVSSVCNNTGLLNLSGGSPVGGTYFGNAVNASTFNPVLAGQGQHSIAYTFTDARGCKDTASANIQVDTATTVSLSPIAALCQNAPAILLNQGSPSGGQYSGVPGLIAGNLYPNLAGAGNYTLNYTYTNAFGCVSSDTTTVRVNALPQVSIASQWKTCAGRDSVPLTGGMPTGGRYFGNFVDTNGFFYPDSSGVGAFLVSYRYTDTNSCSNTQSQLMIVNSLPFVGLSPINDKCINDAYSILTGGFPFGAGGRYKGRAVDSTGNYTPALAGSGRDTVWYIYTDANACSDSVYQSFEIFDLPALSVNLVPNVCLGSEAVNLNFVSPTGGVYSGPGVVGNQFLSSIADTGIHNIRYQFTDTNACKADTNFVIKVNDLPNSSVSNDTLVCKNTLLRLEVQGGVAYRWENGSTNAQIDVLVNAEEEYFVTVSSPNNCERIHSIRVDLFDTLSVRSNVTSADCGERNASLSVNVSGGQIPYRFKWNTGAESSALGNLGAGVYVVTITDQNLCELRELLIVSDRNAPQIVLDSIKHNDCFGDTQGFLQVSAPNASNYVWSNFVNANAISNLAAGEYFVQVSDSNGCKGFGRYRINQSSPIRVDVDKQLPNCGQNDGLMIAKASGGLGPYTYTWTGNVVSDTLAQIVAGSYLLSVSDAKACLHTEVLDLNDWGAPAVRLDSLRMVACTRNDGAIYVSSSDTGQVSFSWSNASNQNSISNLSTGIYSVSVTNQNGCAAIRSYELEPIPPSAPELCLVSSDSAEALNQLHWDPSGLPGNVFIYRSALTNANADLLGVVPAAQASYTDTAFNQLNTSAEYFLKTRDACNVMSPKSLTHKTVFVRAEKDRNGFVKLNWNAYGGAQVEKYFVYRFRGSVGLELIDSLSSVVLNYTNLNTFKETEQFYYFVGYRLTGNCSDNALGLSNYTRNFAIPVNALAENSSLAFKLYPNPSRETIYIDFLEKASNVVHIKVINLQGSLVFESVQNIGDDKRLKLDISNLSSGSYLIQVKINESDWGIKKLIVN